MSVVLVTGAGGFVGSAIARCLVHEEGRLWDGSSVEHVVGVLRPGGSEERIAELEHDARWSVEHADSSDREALREIVAKTHPRAIVHAALDAGVYDREDEMLVRRPLEALIDALDGMRSPRLILVGSAWTLAAGEGLGETATLGPVNAYGRNKVHEEHVLTELATRAGFRWMTLRLFNLFGRYEPPTRLLPTLVANLSLGRRVELTHGEQLRDFNDVEVASHAFARALDTPDAAWDAVYHVGSGRGTTVREFAFAVADIVGGRELIHFGGSQTQDETISALVSDPTLARNVLRWRPDTDLESRIRKAVEWWLPRLEPCVSNGART